MRAAGLVTAALAALLLFPVRSTAAPKNVLIVRGESPDLPGGNILIQSIEESLRASSVAPVEFYIETIDTGRFTAEYEDAFAHLLASKYADVRVDLVIALSQPAAQFVVQARPSLFPAAPVLYGLVEKTMAGADAIPPGGSAVYVSIDAAGTLHLAKQLYPAMRRVLVTGGVSRFDRGWQRVVRDQLRGIDPAIQVAYDVDSSLEVMSRHVASLPPDTVVFYVSMTRDGGGTPSTPIHALETLRATALVPVFGLTNTYVGHGSAGGLVLDFNRHGADLGRQAASMLAGAVPPPIATPPVAMVDWRELRRFRMAESRLPAGAATLFREAGIWESQKTTILIAGAVILAQTALMIALVRSGRRRREAQQALVERLRFEQILSEFSVSIATAPAAGISLALEAALGRLALALGTDRILRWRPGDPRDGAWDASPLRTGEVQTIGSLDDLPPTVRERIAVTGGSCSALVMSLAPPGGADGGAGALFWISRRSALEWSSHTDQFRTMAAVVATVLQRKQAETALQENVQLKGAILDSLPAHVAVLDRDGIIIAVNDAWSRFADDNGGRLGAVGPGASYLRACHDAAAKDVPGADDAAEMIVRACRGERTWKQVQYPCGSANVQRWFLMAAEPLRCREGGAVIAHWDITAMKLNEIALRESEDRFRRMADALPVAIWMSDEDGGCSYFNRGWLELTGRTLDEESGDGWLESVHVADRSACMDAFLRAFHVREPFRIEYRLRRYDGQYRWVVDHGVPRYGTDGAFHGYIGGCLDITNSKEAEQTLRSLSHRLMNAQDDERRRIARELHDHLSQQLALLAIDLQQLSMRRPASQESLATALQEAWRRTTEIASDVHAISHRLHPAKMEALGLVATMRTHCRDISRQSLVVEFLDRDVPPDIPPDRALSLFRVLEEALSNVVRHSGAHSAHVVLAGADGSLTLHIADDGHGFDAADGPAGLGLISIRERVQSLDGTVKIASTPGQGTTIDVRIPAAQPSLPAAALTARADSA